MGLIIPIAAPINNHTDYYNRKGDYSMVLQGLVGANYRFLNVCIVWPGSVHDARVFIHSLHLSYFMVLLGLSPFAF